MREGLVDWDKRYLWHPFTQQTEWQAQAPLIITSAKGVWLKDQHGRRLLDGNSSLWVNVWGHCDPNLDRALKRQLGRMAHSTFLGLTHAPAIRLAKALVGLAPKNIRRVFYSDNGSTAVEVALKMAYQYWQLQGQTKRTRFVSLKDGYHGDTIGSVSVGGVELFHARFRDLIFKGWQVRPPYRHALDDRHSPRSLAGNLSRHGPPITEFGGDEIDKLLQKHHRSVAAVVMEPLVQGASGILVMVPGYLKHVERLCRKYGVLLIVDEVATGFGRTGTMFAVEQENVQPDFLCVAKSLTGGYLPLAATLTTEAIYKTYLGRYDDLKAFFHGHTYTANPLACAVALENLKLYKQKNLLKNVRGRTLQLQKGLKPLKSNANVVDIRQIGLMVGIQLKGGRSQVVKTCQEAIQRGVWLRPLGDVLVVMPPLAISEGEMRFLVKVLGRVLDGKPVMAGRA